MDLASKRNTQLFDDLHSLNATGVDNIMKMAITNTTTSTNNNMNNSGTEPDKLLSLVDPYELQFFTYTLSVVKAVAPAEFVIGLISNLIAFAVLCRKTYRSSSTAVYLRALAVFDFFVLMNNALAMAIAPKTMTYKWICFLFDYTLIICINSSNWTLVLITIERLLAILMPHHVFRIMTKRTAYTAIIIMVICMMIIDSHDFFFYNEAGWERCQISYSTEPAKSVIRVFKIIHTLKFVFIPLPVIVIGNVVIIIHLRRQKKLVIMARANFPTTNKIHKHVNTKNSVQNLDDTGETPVSKISSLTDLEKSITFSESDLKRSEKTESYGKVHIPRKVTEPSWRVVRKDRDRGLTVTLLALNVCYLVTRVPFEIYNMSLGMPPSNDLTLSQYTGKLIVGTMSLLNNTVNVFLYFAAGSRFRNEFKAMVKEIWTKLRACV